MTKEEKVCLTAGQIENIGKAYAKNFPAPTDVCPKADSWVKAFFGKGKSKKKREPKDPVESWVQRKVMRKIDNLVDGFF